MIENEWEKILKNCKKLKILCGAGISYNSGLPLANSILEYLFIKIGFSKDDAWRIINYEIPFEVWMQLFISSRKDGEDLLHIFKAQELTPCRNHRMIAKLIAMGIVKDVYTANFDVLIEQALEDEGLQRDVDYKVFYKEEQFSHITECTCARIIKFHGSIEDYESIRITLDDIVADKKNSDRYQAIQPMFEGKEDDVLFVFGYSCSDYFDVQPCLKAVLPPHVTILYVQHSNLENITNINYDKEWPEKKFDNYNGYLINGRNDTIVNKICELYNLYFNKEDHINNDSILLLDKYTQDYFNLFSVQGDYQIIMARILRKIGFSSDAYIILNDICNSKDIMNDQSQIIHLKAQILLQLHRAEDARNAYKQELISRLVGLISTNDSLKISKFTQIYSNDFSCQKVILQMEEVLLRENVSFLDDLLVEFIGAFLGYSSSLIELNEGNEAKEILCHLEHFYDSFFSVLKELRSEKFVMLMKAAILNEKALSYKITGEYKKALSSFQESVEIKKSYGDIEGMSNSLNNMIEPFVMINDFTGAINAGKESLQLRESINSSQKVFESLMNMMLLALEINDTNILNEYLDKIKNNIDKYSQYIGELNSLILPLFTKINIIEYNDAITDMMNILEGNFTEESCTIIKKAGNDRIDIAKQQQMMGSYKQACNSFGSANFLFSKIRYSEGIVGCKRCAGILYELSGMPDEALCFYQQSLESIDYDCTQKARTLAQMGIYYSRRGDKKKALENTNKALEMFEALGETEATSYCQIQFDKIIKGEIIM